MNDISRSAVSTLLPTILNLYRSYNSLSLSMVNLHGRFRREPAATILKRSVGSFVFYQNYSFRMLSYNVKWTVFGQVTRKSSYSKLCRRKFYHAQRHPNIPVSHLSRFFHLIVSVAQRMRYITDTCLMLYLTLFLCVLNLIKFLGT